jgi:DnaB-like helicase N terminal domain/AAA domain
MTERRQRNHAEKPLPHSPEVERAFLGGLILSGGNGPDLDSTDFHLPFHQSLYRSIRRLKQEGKPVDLVLLHDCLTPAEIEETGGMPFIAGLVNDIPRTSNLEHYAETIKTKAAVRRRIALCDLMGEKLAAANGDASEVLREVSALSAPLREEVEQKRILGFKSGLDLAITVDQEVAWIAKGLVAKGSITELGAKVKAGKTTLVLEMVRAVLDGERFLDLPTVKTAIVYLTEQPSTSFRQSMNRAHLLGREDFHSLFFSETYGLAWPQVAAAAFAQCKRVGAGLLVIDTLSQFAGLTGDRENNSGDALEAMLPLQQGVADGTGIVLVRHERKSGGDVGDSGRGSSAFAGAVDIVLSLRKPEGNSPKNRRLLQSLSRFTETPNDLLIELTDAGYILLGERRETALKDAKDAIFRIAPRVEAEAIGLEDITKAAELTRPTAQRAIDELVRDGQLIRNGKGKRGNPFRYSIPEVEIPFCSTSYIEGQKEKNPPAPAGEWKKEQYPD